MWSFFLVFGLLFWGSHGSVTCRNEHNAEVDWYILYKTPKTNILSGTEYIYIDSSNPSKKLNNINSPGGVLANTLKPLFRPIRDMEETFGFILYSDQPPGSSANPKKFGHSKGIVMVEKDRTGVWISHSTPQFPFRRKQNNFWPSSGNKNAQTFICVKFNYDEFAKIGRHLQRIHAFPHEHYIPDNFHRELIDVVNWTEDLPAPGTEVHIELLTFRPNQVFKTFAKRTSDNDEDGDLYLSIASDIKSSVYAQSWRCNPGSSPSHCSNYEVINVEDVTIDNLWRWKPKSDHSKWCVAVDQNKHWTCIADMNREESQYRRYGGALCIQNEQVQRQFRAFANHPQTCRKRPAPDCEPNTDGDDFRSPIIIDRLG